MTMGKPKKRKMPSEYCATLSPEDLPLDKIQRYRMDFVSSFDVRSFLPMDHPCFWMKAVAVIGERSNERYNLRGSFAHSGFTYSQNLVLLERTNNFMHKEYWMLCPSCGKETQNLYLVPYKVPDLFGCRKCHQLTYLSCLDQGFEYPKNLEKMRSPIFIPFNFQQNVGGAQKCFNDFSGISNAYPKFLEKREVDEVFYDDHRGFECLRVSSDKNWARFQKLTKDFQKQFGGKIVDDVWER